MCNIVMNCANQVNIIIQSDTYDTLKYFSEIVKDINNPASANNRMITLLRNFVYEQS